MPHINLFLNESHSQDAWRMRNISSRHKRDIFIRSFVCGLLSEEEAVLIVCVMDAR